MPPEFIEHLKTCPNCQQEQRLPDGSWQPAAYCNVALDILIADMEGTNG